MAVYNLNLRFTEACRYNMYFLQDYRPALHRIMSAWRMGFLLEWLRDALITTWRYDLVAAFGRYVSRHRVGLLVLTGGV